MKRKTTKECFNDLEASTKRLSSLLGDRQEGLMAWNTWLRDEGKQMIKCLQNLGFPVKLDE